MTDDATFRSQANTSPVPPSPLVEPLMNLASFVQTANLNVYVQAALHRWMQVAQQDPYGSYTAPQWHTYLQRCLAHT